MGSSRWQSGTIKRHTRHRDDKHARARFAAVLLVLTAGLTSAATPAYSQQSYSIWSSTATPAAQDVDTNAVEIGVKVQADTPGYITGLRFYKFPTNIGRHDGHLWTRTGVLLAAVTFTNETASGWQQANFSSPVAIAANTTYVASYHAPSGAYAANSQYFETAGVDAPPLHALANGVDGGNGVYGYGPAGTFPANTYHSENYWVDVVFTTSLGPDTTPPAVQSVWPVAGALGVNPATVVGATFTEMMAMSSVNPTTFELRGPAGTVVPAWVSAGGETPTASLTPTSALAYSTTYTATVKGGASGVTDLAGNAMTSDYTWSFTTAADPTLPPPPITCPCSIWPDSAIPQGVDTDTNAVELGVRFRSDVAGYITGLRFYKFSGNTGIHVGNLWTNNGIWLATATFTNETPSGWQQVSFASPVVIAANTTYVASYHTKAGRYGADSNYFASAGYDRGPLHALAGGFDGANGVYRYGPTSAFPDQTYGSTNYWVDVVFSTTPGPDTTPPAVQWVTPTAGALGVSPTAVVGAEFTEMLATSSVNETAFELRDPAGNLVPAVVRAGGETPTASLTPATALAYSTTYTATIKGGASGVKDLAGNALISGYSWSFTTAPDPTPPLPPSSPPSTCPCSIWSSSTTAAGQDPDTNAVEIGVKFQADTPGYITALRFYKFAGNTGPHVGHLWTRTGVLLATVTFTNETASGWQQASLLPPVAIAANTTYVASYHAPAGGYSTNSRYFETAGVDTPPLHALASGVDGGNGVYGYGPAGTFPANTYNSENYWVDVVFTGSAPSDTTPPAVSSVTPAAGATGVSPTTVVTATFTEMIALSSINPTTFELRDPAGNLVPASAWAGGETPTATLDPTSALASATTYTATVKGGASGVKDLAGNALLSDFSWSFTTAPDQALSLPPSTCPCSIWSSSTIPAGPDPDTNAVELGVRFRADTPGYITALRFYKFATNIGRHDGHLWTSTGVLLATVTFTNETSSGWQQANLSPPVAIAANTTYIASYHAPVGYAANSRFFETAGVDAPPLHALASGAGGGNGVYGYGPSGTFPDQTYLSTNYWVDVVFTTTP